jgi:hypothetical protein
MGRAFVLKGAGCARRPSCEGTAREPGTTHAQAPPGFEIQVEFPMDVTGLMVAMFLLGIVSMTAFYAFLLACEKV